MSRIKARYKLLNRKRKFKRIPIPRIIIQVKYRTDGSWCYSFGNYGYKQRVAEGTIYDEQGVYIPGQFWYAQSGGQDYTIKSFWRYLSTYRHRVHPLDIAK